MGTSLQTKPKLQAFNVNSDGSHSEAFKGKYTLAAEAQWLVDRQHSAIQDLRKEVRSLRDKVAKDKKRRLAHDVQLCK